MKQDASLHDIYAAEELTSLNPGKICWQVHQLKEVWQQQRPKLKRLSCDSFVLSIKVHQEKQLYCGLNNGSLQASPCSFIQILSRFFPDFTRILAGHQLDISRTLAGADISRILEPDFRARFQPDFSQILARFQLDFSQIIAMFSHRFFKTSLIQILSG